MIEHDTGCPMAGQTHTDAARRASDAVQLHVTAIGMDAIGRWVAVRLSDGGSDGICYDSKRDAVRHQLTEQQCAYVCIPPTGMSPCSAESFLKTHRALYDSGFRLVDPDAEHGGREVIPRLTHRDHAAALASLRLR